MSGPGGAVHGVAGNGYGNGYGSQWSDNIGRMHLFMQRHPEIKVTVPRENGTRDFIATRGEEEIVRDTSLGWLMDHLEKRFPDASASRPVMPT